MQYPFYLAENLTPVALAGDHRSFTDLLERNFTAIMNTRNQTPTVKWLRVVQLQAHITRAVLRAGGKPYDLFAVSQSYLERISRISVHERAVLKELIVEYSREALNRLPAGAETQSGIVQRFLRSLENCDLRTLTVQSLADVLHVTPSHLCRAVRQATGRTPTNPSSQTRSGTDATQYALGDPDGARRRVWQGEHVHRILPKRIRGNARELQDALRVR